MVVKSPFDVDETELDREQGLFDAQVENLAARLTVIPCIFAALASLYAAA